MGVDAPDTPARSPPPASLISLAQLTRSLAIALGLVRPAEESQNTVCADALRYDAPVTATDWKPLISTADLSLLLSVTATVAMPDDSLSVPGDVDPASATAVTRTHLLDALARLALNPSLTIEVLTHFRPIAAAIVGKWFELLGLDDEGEWRNGEAGVEMAQGELDAVDKVWKALVRAFPLMGQEAFPFLRLLFRHPLLVRGPPLPPPSSPNYDSALVTSLLTLHSLIHHLPSLPAFSGWCLPIHIEQLMKRHPHRGIRLVAWRILRAWLGLFATTGERLKRQWVWRLEPADVVDEEKAALMPLAPPVPYPAEVAAEYTEIFGPDQASQDDADDLLPFGWGAELVESGQSRLVDGGLEVLVRNRGVDPWVLPFLEDTRAKEEQHRADLLSKKIASSASQGHGIGAIEGAELGKTVVLVSNTIAFREGLVPSLTRAPAPPSTTLSLTNAAAPAASPTTTAPEPFVTTPAHSALLAQLADSLKRRVPTLITGTPSCGKQSAISHLWNLVHASLSASDAVTAEAKRRGLVVINMADRSLDSKSLLGSLSSAPSSSSGSNLCGVGHFTFVEGPFTRAVRQGRWTLLLNIDQAAPELLSVVKVVAERMSTSASVLKSDGRMYGGIGAEEQDGGVGLRIGGGEGRWVKAGEGFMLFATRSVSASSLVTTPPPATFFASHFFEEAVLSPLNSNEVAQIVQGRYGASLDRVTGLARVLVDAWECVREAVRDVKDTSGGGTKREIGVRDLLRWCRRVAALLPASMNLAALEANPTLQEEVFVEARDVFLGSLVAPPASTATITDPSTSTAHLPRDRFSVIARSLASSLGLSDERADWALKRRVPDVVLPTIDTSSGLDPSTSSSAHSVKIGRVSLPYAAGAASKRTASSRPYALTKPSLLLLEKLAVCLSLSEPVLLVGETGTGKTAAIGYLAELMGKRLTALNLSNQTEAGDLVGGFRPIDEAEEARRTASELVNRFVELFGATFSLSRNGEYISAVRKAFDKKRYNRLVDSFRQANRMAAKRFGTDESAPAGADDESPQAQRKRRKVDGAKAQLVDRWKDFMSLVGDFEHSHVLSTGGKGKAKFVFSFVEGPLAQAIRNGDWVLLDEVNLASSETLESLATLLQAPDSSLVLTEKGELEPIPRHPEFRLFACMNPATDVGKRDLPIGLRAKFSELWVPPPDEDRDALRTIVEGYIGRVAISDRQVVADAAELYSAVKLLAMRAQLADGQNVPPHFSMRTLARALSFAADFAPTFGLRRALYEGFVMAFTMLLDERSQSVVRALIDKHVVQPAKNPRSLMERVPTKPASFDSAIRIHHYWLEQGPHEPEEPDDYILTSSVQAKVCDLARAVLTRKVPVLIQGPTSAGKTSVVEYLARRTGHRFVRINNHEHTDIQEYVGNYVSDPHTGKLVLREGLLVRALRRGDWIVLDELNLAPTDVLEALNRLLDDNRELVIPETGEVVRPHPHFMLFATQNPPGLYGGRKVLSRAFRNRFLEMHFGDVPKDELKTILERRCRIAPSHAEKTVNVFLELQRRRQAGRVFEQKQAFATLRDLFRWGNRGPVETIQQLAEDGYMLLAERARRADDKQTVKEVIEEVLKVRLDEATLYDFERLPKLGLPVPPQDSGLVWTSAMRRLYFLIAASLQRHEPVLLVGETGAGKTSVCQALAHAVSRLLHIVGCHQNTETADLLGGQRPLRNRASLQAGLQKEAAELLAAVGRRVAGDDELGFDDVLGQLEAHAVETKDAVAKLLADRMHATTALFEWHDGPLVQAMRGGDLILLDEISLADDSVLERLNSVLEPSRTLVLAEKSGHDLDDIRVVGQPGFEILATMNPGGDFGKKELSPALRNRFTEIWVPAVDNADDLLHIIGSRWSREHRQQLNSFGPKMLDFARWFAQQIGQSEGLGIGLRDILGWVDFLNAAARHSSGSSLPLPDAFCQGALMTVVDGLGALPATSGLSRDGLAKLKASCWRYIEQLVPTTMAPESLPLDVVDGDGVFSIGPFGVNKGELAPAKVDYTLLAPTTRLNAMRLLRALQLTKPVLLEGSPGVGKTSLVTALAAATGHPLVRINLSDQTDLMDLLGSDLPVEGGKSGEFAWKDAPFLAAMQNGAWVLLDEMNLASQSVLEGLNSCLDHRGAVYIPELDRTFSRHPDFRIFAAQNPLGQGGGRKGLPKSFLDRFSLVHMEELDSTDLNAIASALFPEVDVDVLSKMIEFNSRVHRETMDVRHFGTEGSPWEFNLRDVLRWLTLVRSSTGLDIHRRDPLEYVRLLYLQRFRNSADREYVSRLFAEAFGLVVDPVEQPWPLASSQALQVGHSLVTRGDSTIAIERASVTLPTRRQDLQPFEALAKCLDMGWLAILTGPRGTGKTALVRQLAALGGQRLREFTMNAEVDTLELLGSFEQADRLRDLDSVARDAIDTLKTAVTAKLATSDCTDFYEALAVLRRARLALATEAADLDIATIGGDIRRCLASTPFNAADLLACLDTALTTADAAVVAARFEWVDGPLVQAMKNGDWLLIEDANLCSPSVLDRLNSLFETGGRLQLAERGPVNGEIQIIDPHPNFRLVMTLDPRNGELSRAMRNRGIEIAVLSPPAPMSARASLSLSAAFSPFTRDDFREPAFSPIARLAHVGSVAALPVSRTAIVQQLASTVSSAQLSLSRRVLRQISLVDIRSADFCLRQLEQHPLVQHAVAHRSALAKQREVPFNLFAVQPIDPSLVPLAAASSSESLVRGSSALLEAFASLAVTPSASPFALSRAAAQPVRSLNVFDKSMLASRGKLKLDEADSTVAALYPLYRRLATLVSHLAGVESGDLPIDEQANYVGAVKTVQALTQELEVVSNSIELDFSTVQHVVAWIGQALAQFPASLASSTEDVDEQLAPLRRSLTLTSGKAMDSIWRASLPFKPASPALAAALEKLVAKGKTTGEVWDKSIATLFLEICVVLGAPQPASQVPHEDEALRIIEQLLARIPTLAQQDLDDPVVALAQASNAAGLIATELAAVARVMQDSSVVLPASALVKIAQQSGAAPITDVVALHQLALWPANEQKSKPAALFATLSTWSSHLARGLSETSVTSPADIARPSLLARVIDLRLGETPTLGNLVTQSASLARAASLQLVAATAETAPRQQSLHVALLALIALVINTANDQQEPTEDRDDLAASIAKSAGPPALDEAKQRYLAASLPSLLGDEANLEVTSAGFVAFARFLWHLYVPNLPLDPAIGLRAQSGFVARQFEAMSYVLNVVRLDEVAHSGNGRNAKLDRVQAEVDDLRQRLERAGVAPIGREGNTALLSALFTELRSFSEQIISDHQIDSLLAVIANAPSASAVEREVNLQHSVDTLLRRLDHAYGELEDVVAPVRLALTTLKIGFALLAYTASRKAGQPALRPYEDLVHHLTAFPTVSRLSEISAAELPLSIKASEAPWHPAQATLLQVAATVSSIVQNVRMEDGIVRLTQLYERLHFLWATDRRREEETAEEANSLYKAKVDVQQVQTDEEIEAAEFAELFPTYDLENGISHAKPSKYAARLLQPADYVLLARLHAAVFAEQLDGTLATATSAFERLRSSGVDVLLPRLYATLSDDLDVDSTAYRVRNLVELSQAARPRNAVGAPHHDFYSEPDVRETTKAVPVLLAFIERLDMLVAEFPDQMVLQGLRERCEAILKLTSKAPIALVLTNLEQLLQQTEDWEKFADRAHSVSVNRTTLTDLIIAWRRHELTCWSRLLSTVAIKFNESVAEWWFRFYEIAIRSAPGVDNSADQTAEASQAYYRELVQLLDSFFNSCSIGQYGARLELLLGFANYAAALASRSDAENELGSGAKSLARVANLLHNVHAFYGQYSARISAHLVSERAKIDKEVQNVVKLASWKDINVVALRASAVRSHHQLYKCVRKLRTVLQKPASDLFQAAEVDKVASASFSPFVPLDVASLASVPELSVALSQPDEPTHLVKLDHTVSRLANVSSASLAGLVGAAHGSAMTAFVDEIVTTAKALREEPLGPEEGRQQRVKNLIERKRRAWRDLLNELKRIGVSPSPSPKTLARLEDAGTVYSLQPSHPVLGLDDKALGSNSRVAIVKADAYHARQLAQLPILKAFPASHHADVRTADVQRALGHIQSGIAAAHDQRALLLDAVRAQIRLKTVATGLQEPLVPQPSSTAGRAVQELLATTSKFAAALSETRDALCDFRTASLDSAHEASTPLHAVDAALAKINRDRDALWQVETSMGGSDPILLAPHALELSEQAQAHLKQTIETFAELAQPPSLRYILGPLVAYLSSLDTSSANAGKSPAATQKAGIRLVKAAHDDLINSVLVVAQKLKTVADEGVNVVEDEQLVDGGFKVANSTYITLLSTLRLDEVTARIEAFARQAHKYLRRPSDLESVQTLASRVAPFVRIYSDLVSRQIASLSDWHHASLKLNHVVSSILSDIALEGFCRPPEGDGQSGADADQADGKTTEGTGMAEGTGDKNVSNEIEDESQVEGLQNDVPQDKREDEQNPENGDDDAIEMNQEFEGDLEDRGDGAKESGEDEDEDENDEAEPEEQVADVDPLDPSSVDEKFWGDDQPPSENKDGKTDEVNQETSKSAGEVEMGAKEEEQAAAPKPNIEEAEEAGAEEEKTDEAKQQGGEEQQQDGAEGEQQEGMEDDAQGEEGEQADQETGERLDNQMPETDNLDLPDDMNLDGEEKDQDVGEDEDDLDLPDEMDNMAEEGGEGENTERPNELEELGDAKGENVEQDEDPLAANPETQPQPDNEDDAKVDAEAVDQSLGGADQGETGGEGEQDASATKDDFQTSADNSRQSGAQSLPQTSTEPAADQDGGDQGETAMEEDADAAPPTAASATSTGPSKQRAAADPSADSSAQQQGPQDQSPLEQPRSLGDSLQNWRRRLEAIGDLAQPDEQDSAAAPDSQQEGAVEYVQEGDEQEVDEQALGPASEEQVKKLEQLHIGDELASQDAVPTEDDMDVDEPAQHPQQQSTSVQLKGSSLAESDAKAVPASEFRSEQQPVDEDREMEDEGRVDDGEHPSTTFAPSIDPEENAAVEQAMIQWRSGDDANMTAEGVWRLYESLTRDLSFALTEQLRLILEPTLATRLKGDYRSGKRLNMKKIIPYIASEFTKDKIWLRRTRPSQREYQVTIAIDDSKSMADSHSVHLAFQSLALISRALTRLEVGQVSISRFGESMEVLHPFEAGVVSDEAGAKVLGKFTFQQRSTDVAQLVERSLAHLAQAKESARSGKSSLSAGDLWQLNIIISDGICQDHERLRSLLRKATEQKVQFVFVVLDSLHRQVAEGTAASSTSSAPAVANTNQNSILHMKSVRYEVGAHGRLELKMERYLDTFPFEYWTVVRDIDGLPDTLSQLLRQFFDSTMER
ncbi:midasin [Rhodotorula toruloides]|uniref:Midasin n=1 Tax=Rhodotorula toruloides TaxID=5286 RepID=A0A511KHW0_RHOTO|nr:midasin [Rhodotorula toruloides]